MVMMIAAHLLLLAVAEPLVVDGEEVLLLLVEKCELGGVVGVQKCCHDGSKRRRRQRTWGCGYGRGDAIDVVVQLLGLGEL